MRDARPGVVRISSTEGNGSGFIVSADGYIMTNEHVIAGASELNVTLEDGTRLSPRIVGTDSVRDIALLKVEIGYSLTALSFADGVTEGEDVIALGYPLDYQDSITVTRGIVSGIRQFDGVEYVQTDAAINPGNSGDPLLNENGDIVGMNTSIRREIDGRDYPAQGIGFAISYKVLTEQLPVLKRGTAGNTPTPTPTPSIQFVYGPKSGSILHDKTDTETDRYFADVDMRDFVAGAEFTNPYSPVLVGADWDYGILFRNSMVATHAVVIRSDGSWEHFLQRSGNSNVEFIDYGYSSSINTGQDEKNWIIVVAEGAIGFLSINGEIISLDLSGLQLSGDIAVAANFYRANGIHGLSTRFTNFAIAIPE